MSEENKLHIKDIKKSIIPNYQRGYKWEDKNIKELLDDINSINDNEKKEHCLHNLTIIENNNEWEIIDGQQRLTTIFLILKYLDEEYYSLDYKIRTKNFLSEEEEVKNIIQNLKENKYKNKTELFEEVRKNKQDIYYICQALFTIHNWFNNKDKPVEKAQFIKKLKDNVYFYKHIVKDIKGETVFSNLNSGRVPLTDIELIKADLIINISDDDEKTKKIDDNKEVLINEIRSNIGRLWDEMESYLAQDEVWYWIAPEDKSVNKLSLLFNLLWSELKKEGEKIEGKNIYEKYYNYIYNENKVCDYKKLKEIWEKIKNYYYTIKDWYLDNDMYHLIGIIVSFGGAIDEFFENNSNKYKDKRNLKNELKNKIIEKLKLNNEKDILKVKDKDYLELNYTEDKDVLNKIFTLLNCLEGYNNDKGIFYEHFRYRFDIHNKYNWSIEHIIPQKPDDKTILVYFNDIINYFKEYNNDTDEKVIKLKEINKKIEIKLSEPEYEEFKGSIEKLILSNNDKLKEAFVEDLKKYLPNFNDFIGIHNIKNLALLDKDTNSSLQNLPFKEKRNELLKSINDNGVFIPALTLKVFSKTFKGANAEGMYWTPKDFDKYEEYQEKKLKGFINSIEKRGNNNE